MSRTSRSGGQIVPSERVYRSLTDGYRARRIELDLKGKAGPVTVYIVDARSTG